ncbi:cadmium resistance transporter [Chroococcus sp. FPU101]|uniref:cadmium resistance transporter n=1 Tax=Chroococcus sp. FPU101 TaxID=1974212 RepID=UPI001A8FA1E3|nr:cadmium resistance transporter [Chroococcus sp. FPU101]GFE71577.1 cadmium resistance transporter [Chroococcus sp. FPU101]
MNWFLTTLIAGITSFIATNIDDILLLMLFFSKNQAKFGTRQIVIGQYLGFTILILFSLPGLFGGLLVPEAWIGLLGLVPIYIGIKSLFKKEDENDEIQLISSETASSPKLLSRILSKETYSVAAVTVANGGDNIGIYVPLFASGTLVQFWVLVGIFYVMLGIWCYTAFLLTRHPVLARFLTHYGEKITPWVLLALGIFIIIENKSYLLFTNF